MNNRLYWFQYSLFLLLLGSVCCGRIYGGEITFELKSVKKNSETPLVFEEKKYRLPIHQANVLAGAYDGLELEFSKKIDNITQTFIFHFPSTNKLRVQENWELKGDSQQHLVFQYFLSSLPLTLTPADFEGLTSGRVTHVRPDVLLTRSIPTSKNSSHVDYFHFSQFSVTLKRFSIKNDRLSLQAIFKGTMDESVIKYTKNLYEVSGIIELSNILLGLTDIE